MKDNSENKLTKKISEKVKKIRNEMGI